MQKVYDLIVIGSGPAGRRAAIQAAKFGKSSLVIERGRQVGGVSVHTGTIPSKTIRETVLNLSGWRERVFYGRSYRVKDDISSSDINHRLLKTLEHEVEILEHQFSRNNVQTIHGSARFIDKNTLEVKGDGNEDEAVKVRGKAILIAVGTRPHRPESVPFDGEYILDSDEIIEINRIPRSLTVIGGGVIGVEYATIFSTLDVPVTLVEKQNTILDFVDRELIDELLHNMRHRGITLRFGQEIKRIEKVDNYCMTHLDNGRVIKSDMVLYAVGRMGAVDRLNLSAIDLPYDNRQRLSVDPQTFQTQIPHIYAAGDIIGFPSLASTSMEQGRIAACHALAMPGHKPPVYFPYGIYSVPEISTCGMTEEEVIKRKIPYECGIARFRETSRGQIMGLNVGIMKLIFSIKTRRLLGVHIVGEGATELVHIGQAVLNLKGKLDYFVENTFNYPTLAEAYKIAALDAWNRMPE